VDFDKEFYKNVTALKGGRAGRKVSLALGGWNDSKGDKYSRLVNDPKARRYVPRIYYLKSDNLQYNMLALWMDGTMTYRPSV
jgi:hypothetical protein